MKISVNNNNVKLPKIKFKGSKVKSEPLYEEIAEDVSRSKAKIDDVEAGKQWDRIKKRTNPYEIIYNSNSWNKKEHSVAKYLAMSRSFYKLWEMMFDYDLLSGFGGEKLVTANLAEGPGGFIEALVQYRSGNVMFEDDRFFGITLKPTSKYIPGWEKVTGEKFRNVRTLFGSLYSVGVVKIYSGIVGAEGGAHIVTADGGFDYSVDFNQQERLSYHLIFAEIVSALMVQKVGGHFVCKVFDIFDKFSLKCLYLLTYFYKSVSIIKPKTSRPANSEKYVVAKEFIGISDENKEMLMKCLEDFEKVEKEMGDELLGFDLEGLELSSDFVELIGNYNVWYCNKQISCIERTLSMIDTKLPQDEYNKVLENQVSLAIEWCDKYHVEINKDSFFVKKFGKDLVL
jgi:23S rRNA U2552 (ribose-2'-O)-methylase RlmE/FtsJ